MSQHPQHSGEAPASVQQIGHGSDTAELVQPFRVPGFLLLFHGIALVLFGLAWVVDEPAFHLMNGWYNGPVPLNGELHQIVLSLAMYGQALGIGLTLLLMLLLDGGRPQRVVALALVLVAVGLSNGALKTLAGRERPLEAAGKTAFHGPHRGFISSRNQSFPSGHTATAFALSCCLAKFYPRSRMLVWALAWGVGLNRVITVRHFASDVVAGAWLGYTLAVGLCARVWVWKLADFLGRLLSLRLQTTVGRDRLKEVWQPRRLLSSPKVLVIVSLAVYWAGNAETGLWDRDEPRFATATREMIERNDWLVPTFNGELRPDKPILIYWLMRSAYAVFGDNPFAARFFSGVAASLACLVVYRLGTEMFGRSAGLTAAWMLALCPMLVVEAKLATVDSVLLFFLACCFWALWRAGESPHTTGAALGFWLALGLAVLTKGPVAVGVVFAAVVCICLVRRQIAWLKGLRIWWGLPLAAAVVAPWCVAVQQATDGKFLEAALGHHVLRRSLEPLEGHRGFPGFYIVSMLGLMAPWSWLVPWSIRRHWGLFRSDPRLAFLSGWAVGPLILFELVQTKLVHYYLPAYPALALLIASAMTAQFGDRPTGLESFDRRIGWLPICVAILLGLAAVGGALALLPPELAAPACVAVGLLCGGIYLAGLLVRRQSLPCALAVSCGALAVAYLVIGTQLLPIIHRRQIVVEVAQRLKALQPQQALALWLYRDPSIIYHVGSVLPVVDPVRSEPPFDDAQRYARRTGRFICPMTTAEFEAIAQDRAISVQIVETITTFDPSRLRERTVHLAAIEPAAALRISASEPAQGRGEGASRDHPVR